MERKVSRIAGIDPGLKGAIAITEEGRYIGHWKTPVIKNGAKSVLDLTEIVRIFEMNDVDLVMIEKVHSMPKQGVSSVFTFGEGYGSFKGILAALAIPYSEVTPQSWQKIMFAGISKDLGKKRSIYKIGQLFPSLTKINDGIADALCISLYGYHLAS